MIEKLKKYRKWIMGAAIAALVIFIPKTYGGVDQAGIRWEYNILTLTLRFEAEEGSDGIMYDYEQMSCEEQEEDWKAPWWKYRTFCRKVIFGKGIHYIGYEACADFGFLKEVQMTDDVEKIGERAFFGCNRLRSFQCPPNLKSIQVEAFCESGLQTVQLDEGLSHIGMEAFSMTPLKKIDMPDTVEFIGGRTFYCTVLKEVTISKGMNVIPNRMFEACIQLKTVTIPDSVKTIEDEAFSAYYEYPAAGLTYLCIPKNVEKIGSRILKNNQSIKRIRIESTKLKHVSTKAFTNINPDVVFEVPKEKFQEYQQMLNRQDMPKKPHIETF